MANTQTSVPLFVANAVLTAAQQNISAATGVPVFATTVTRDAAFGGSNKALAEGQLCYLESTDVVQYYTGAAWATVGGGTGKVLQTVSAGYSTSTSTTSTSYVTTNLTASITPSSVSNKVVVIVSLPIQCPSAQNTFVTLFRGTVAGTDLAASANGFALVSSQTGGILNESVAICHNDSPSTTSAQAYTVGMKVSGGTAVAFLSTTTGGITLMEISA